MARERLLRPAEDGIVSGISFNISGTDILGNKVNETVTTGENGQVKKRSLPGTYLVTEIPVDRYVTPPAQYVTIESGQTAAVHFKEHLKEVPRPCGKDGRRDRDRPGRRYPLQGQPTAFSIMASG